MKFQFMAEHQQDYPVATMCRALEVSVSGYYAWCQREPSQHSREDAELADKIKTAFVAAIDAFMEVHVSTQSCMRKGFIAADQRVARLMQKLELVAKRPRHRTITTKSEEGAPLAPNLLQQDFHADQPNQKWTSDTTYIWTQEGWLSLAVVLDLFSRMVVGWAMAATQDATLVSNALEMALARRCPQAEVLHHSDRGSTYTSESYLALLKHNGMVPSMSRTARGSR